jgi:hypothetical protein
MNTLSPVLNKGEYVFCTQKDVSSINRRDIICEFKEAEGTTIILERQIADQLKLRYYFVAAWITLNVKSALNVVGLTATFSTELARHNISCNVVAGYYHDHIFVGVKDGQKAMEVLLSLTENSDS